MSAKIRNPRSRTANKVWSTSEIGEGELAISIKDQKLYSANTSAIFELGGGVPNITPTTDRGKQLVVSDSDVPAWQARNDARGLGFKYRRATSVLESVNGNFSVGRHPTLGKFISLHRNDIAGQNFGYLLDRYMGGTIYIYDSVEDRHYAYAINSHLNHVTYARTAIIEDIPNTTNPTDLPALTSDCYITFTGPTEKTRVVIQATPTNQSPALTSTSKTITLPSGDTMDDYESISVEVRLELGIGSTADTAWVEDRIDVFHATSSSLTRLILPIAKASGGGGLGISINPSAILKTSTSFDIGVVQTDISRTPINYGILPFALGTITGRKN